MTLVDAGIDVESKVKMVENELKSARKELNLVRKEIAEKDKNDKQVDDLRVQMHRELKVWPIVI